MIDLLRKELCKDTLLVQNASVVVVFFGFYTSFFIAA